jgi:hypothetical protein
MLSGHGKDCRKSAPNFNMLFHLCNFYYLGNSNAKIYRALTQWKDCRQIPKVSLFPYTSALEYKPVVSRMCVKQDISNIQPTLGFICDILEGVMGSVHSPQLKRHYLKVFPKSPPNWLPVFISNSIQSNVMYVDNILTQLPISKYNKTESKGVDP